MHKVGTYVDRRVAAPIEAVVAATPECEWHRDGTGLRTRIRLGGVPAEVELLPWSDFMAHVGVRPLSGRTHAWTSRRQQRWFDLAHDFVDEVRARIVVEEIVLPDLDVPDSDFPDSDFPDSEFPDSDFNVWDQRSA